MIALAAYLGWTVATWPLRILSLALKLAVIGTAFVLCFGPSQSEIADVLSKRVECLRMPEAESHADNACLLAQLKDDSLLFGAKVGLDAWLYIHGLRGK